MLVDDDAGFRRSARRALAAEGIEVVEEIADGSHAVVAVERSRPDVVLVDVRMPVVDGLEVARRLRALPEAPAVILTSTIDAPSGRLLADGLALGYLPKDALSLAAIIELIGRPREHPAG